MKLYYTGNSPYARRPRMAARQFGLMNQIEEIDAAPLDAPNNPLRQYGPGGKVPGLLINSGALLCETLVILNHLDEVSGGKLYPTDLEARGFAMQVEGLASLLMESLFYRARENRRDPGEQSPEYKISEKEAKGFLSEMKRLTKEDKTNMPPLVVIIMAYINMLFPELDEVKV